MIFETIKHFFAEPMSLGVIAAFGGTIYLVLTALFLRVLGFNRGGDEGIEHQNQGERDEHA